MIKRILNITVVSFLTFCFLQESHRHDLSKIFIEGNRTSFTSRGETIRGNGSLLLVDKKHKQNIEFDVAEWSLLEAIRFGSDGEAPTAGHTPGR